MKRITLLALLALVVFAWPAMAVQINTSARCPANQACTIGGTNVNSFQIITDDTGDAEFVPPENSIGADDVAVVTDHVILCGQLDENGTIYFGPNTTVFGGDASASSAVGSAACDALDNATEATADAPIFTNNSFKIMGGWCETDGTLGAGETLTFTVRTAAADAVTTDGSNTSLSCSLAAGETDCSIPYGTTTDVAAGATIAIKAVEVSDNADDNAWCRLAIAVK